MPLGNASILSEVFIYYSSAHMPRSLSSHQSAVRGLALGRGAQHREGRTRGSSQSRLAASASPESPRDFPPRPSGERAAATAPAQIPPPRSAPPRRRSAEDPARCGPPEPCPLEQGGGGGGNMEGESTSAVLSGFVLGALAFQHLNTDSDTVSREPGRDLASPRKRTRARARGRRPGRRCPGPACGLPTPPRRLCAVGAAFSRSRAAPEVPPGGEPFPGLALPLATSVYFRAPPAVSRTPAFLSFSSPPFLVQLGCEGIEGSHRALPLPLAGKVAG